MSKRRTKSNRPQDTAAATDTDSSSSEYIIPQCPAGWKHWSIIVVIIALLGVVYLMGMHPGVEAGDVAELQHMAPLMGICHPPGYQIEVLVGKLFTSLPIGESIAWRMNLLMGICGIIGSLALYGAVLRITGKIVSGLVAALTLGFSTIFWSHCLIAEAYVFYATFLLLGIYTTVRFVHSDKAMWLYLTCFLLGATVADRASELFVLPGFVALWYAFRTKVKLTIPRLVVGAAVFVLPFAITVTSFLINNDPSKLAHRDDHLRNVIVVDTSEEITRGHEAKTITAKLMNAIPYTLGLRWANHPRWNWDQIPTNIDKYAWLLSGRGSLGDRYPTDPRLNREQGSGTSIGFIGLLLVVLATVRWRKMSGWLLLGWGLFAGNLVFILWHNQWDNLTFTIPGLAGLALLAGLGATKGPPRKDSKDTKQLRYAGYLIAPLFLLITNFNFVDRTGEDDMKTLEMSNAIVEIPFPVNSAILTTYWPGMRYRYLFWIQADRADMHIMVAHPDSWGKLIQYFTANGQAVFLHSDDVSRRSLAKLQSFTPREIAKTGFVRVNPPKPAQ